jgi:hypothetical protein
LSSGWIGMVKKPSFIAMRRLSSCCPAQQRGAMVLAADLLYFCAGHHG